MRLQGFEKRSFNEEFFGEQIIGNRSFNPLHLDFDKLLRIIPFIGSLGDIQAFVTLQPD